MLGAPNAGEAVLEEPAFGVTQNLLVDEAPPEAMPPLVPLLPPPPHLVEENVERATQGSRPGVPGAMAGRA